MGLELALVALGGVLGAPARYALDVAATRAGQRALTARRASRSPVVPPGTLVVNLAGGFLLGVLAGLAPTPGGVPPLWLTFAGTGFCGAFTTFSTAVVEAVRRAQAGRWAAAAATTSAHLVGSLLALAAGLAVAAS